MNWITIVSVVALFLSACTITVTPLPKHHPVHNSTRHVVKKFHKPSNIKETWWIENYHKLEAAHGDYKIPGDADIQPLPDGRFKVPSSVLTHYQDLLLVTPTPHETP